MPVAERQRIRFGTFEFDPESGELFKNGHKLKLEGQPAQVLSFLLEKPGALVSREDLSKRLWSADTFVDSERILNADIWKLRQALGDNAERPRYIETLPRKGYRFIAEVDSTRAAPSLRESAPAAAPFGRPAYVRWIWVTAASTVCLSAILLGMNLRPVRNWLWPEPTTYNDRPRIRSIAVLPLENLSGDPEQEYLADGMTDALIATLGEARNLRVISRTSSMAYKDKRKPLPEIAKELKVDAIIEGSVHRSRGQVRVTTQLIDASSDRHLWTETFDRKFDDVLTLQSEIAQAIVGEIQPKLEPSELIEIATTRTVNPEAYELYLKGRYQYFAWQQPDKALESFQESIKKDPTFAPAYAGLAAAYNILGFFTVPTETFPKARAAVDKALQLDPNLAEAYAESANIKTRYEWDWKGAEADFKRALALSPNNSQIRSDYAIYLAAVGRANDAIAEGKRARSLDPVSLEANLWLASVYMKTHRFDESIKQFRHVLSVDPSNGIANYQLPWVLAFNGQCEEAIRDYERQNIKVDGFLAYFYGRCGRKAQALDIARELERLATESYVDPTGLAIPFVAIGDKDRALALLKIAYYERDAEMMLLKVDPWWDDLRSDPRFQELLGRMNFPQ
jgi:TolB-like protein/DNA-binding winged helix-turn-helix (wHTH) protein/Tfp pilus assembly protein PilF